MTPNDVEKDLQANRLKPVYLLHGQDRPQIDLLLNRFIGYVPESFRDFNLQSLMADDTPVRVLLDQAKPCPSWGRLE